MDFNIMTREAYERLLAQLDTENKTPTGRAKSEPLPQIQSLPIRTPEAARVCAAFHAGCDD